MEKTTSHPAVKVLAGKPVPAKPAGAGRAAEGERLVAVPLKLTNAGATRWDVPVAAKTTVVDNLGASHPVASTVRAVKDLPLLATPTAVAPGEETTGYVVFSMPTGRTVRSITLGLARSGQDAVTWQVAP